MVVDVFEDEFAVADVLEDTVLVVDVFEDVLCAYGHARMNLP